MHGQAVARAEKLIALPAQRTNAEFTHGLFPNCREKLYPGLPSGRKI